MSHPWPKTCKDCIHRPMSQRCNSENDDPEVFRKKIVEIENQIKELERKRHECYQLMWRYQCPHYQ